LNDHIDVIPTRTRAARGPNLGLDHRLTVYGYSEDDALRSRRSARSRSIWAAARSSAALRRSRSARSLSASLDQYRAARSCRWAARS
jgi:hypothetical protein